MKVATSCLWALLVPVLAAPALAQSNQNDMIYCKAMIASYRDFARSAQVDAEVAVAIAQCDSGNAAAAIPVLEKHLKAAKVPLPPRY